MSNYAVLVGVACGVVGSIVTNYMSVCNEDKRNADIALYRQVNSSIVQQTYQNNQLSSEQALLQVKCDLFGELIPNFSSAYFMSDKAPITNQAALKACHKRLTAINQTSSEQKTPTQKLISDWLQQSINEIAFGGFENWMKQLYVDLKNASNQPSKITVQAMPQASVQFRLCNTARQMG